MQSPSWGENRETQGGSNCNWARVSGVALLTHKSLLGSSLPTSKSSDVRLGAHLLEISLDERQPRWLKGKEFACRPFDPWVGKIPWRRKWQPTPVLLPGESHELRSLVGYSPWVCKESRLNDSAAATAESTYSAVSTKCYKPGLVSPWRAGC